MSAAVTMQRSRGAARIGWVNRGDATCLGELYQAGATRVRTPRVVHGPAQAVLINTSGGLTGGDRMTLAVDAAPDTVATVTSQACEKVYRSAGGVARSEVRVALAARARFNWLPQPAIVFEESSFVRELDFALAPDARLFAIEATVLGRAAMGETVTRCHVRERWRVRSGDRLIWASEQLIEDPAGVGRRASLLGGSRASATLVYAGPDAAERLVKMRELLAQTGGEAGASAMPGVLVGMLVLDDAVTLMGALMSVIQGFTGQPAPRVWSC